jgi:hypothetical protein
MLIGPACPHASSEQGLLKLKATKTYQMASEEGVKRFLRLAGHWPKDTREPRGPEHMAKMKAARGPYSGHLHHARDPLGLRIF